MKQAQQGSVPQSKVEQAREEVEDTMAKMEQTRVSFLPSCSVCMSGWLSVTFVYCAETARDTTIVAMESSSSSFMACNSRLRSAICRYHPPQRAVLSQICCLGERKMVMFQILLDGAEPGDAGTTQLSSPVCRRGGQQDPLGICVVVPGAMECE